VTAQRRADRGRRATHAKPQQLALDALVAPARVLVWTERHSVKEASVGSMQDGLRLGQQVVTTQRAFSKPLSGA
jgi:hypothetical protein